MTADECPRPAVGTAVTIGAYDGVHRGHLAVVATGATPRGRARLATAVVTFDRHPASVVRPDSAPKLLTDLDQKLELLAATGLDHAVVVHFDEERSKESAEDFVREVLVDCLNAKLVVVGADFHFGHGRRGNVELLSRMGASMAQGAEKAVLTLPLTMRPGLSCNNSDSLGFLLDEAWSKGVRLTV